MEAAFQMVRQVVVFLLLAALLTNLFMGTEYKKYFTYVTCACSGAWLFWKRKGMGKKLYSFGKQTAGGTDERGNSSAWRKV